MPRDEPRWPAVTLIVLVLAVLVTVLTVSDIANSRPRTSALSAAHPGGQDTAAITAPNPTAAPHIQDEVHVVEVLADAPSSPASLPLNYDDARIFCEGLSKERDKAGLPRLEQCYATEVRQVHANTMAATFPIDIWHDGDNIVGVAPSHDKLMTAFMASQPHADQILKASYTSAAVACAWGRHKGYVAHVYCTADFT